MIESQLDYSDVRNEVSDAIRQSKAIQIDYISKSSELTNRVVEPVQMDDTLFWAYCRLRQNWRCFRYDRVHEISSLPEIIPARSVPSNLTSFPWQSSGQSYSTARRRSAKRRSPSQTQYRASGSGCALILALPFISLAILLTLGTF